MSLEDLKMSDIASTKDLLADKEIAASRLSEADLRALVKAKVIDGGKIGGKFVFSKSSALEHVRKMAAQ